MRVVSVVGFKKSGKTAAAGLLADALERLGLSVGIVKFTHHGLDRPNTDTFWLMRPGRTVAACGPEEAALFWPREVPVRELIGYINADVVVVEGGKGHNLGPRILCLKEEREALLLGAPGDGATPVKPLPGFVLATIGASPPKKGDYGRHYDELTPEAADELAACIAKLPDTTPAMIKTSSGCSSCPEHAVGAKCPDDCAQKQGRVELCAGGQNVSLNAFVERIVESAARGLLSQLGGYDEHQDIILTLKARPR